MGSAGLLAACGPIQPKLATDPNALAPERLLVLEVTGSIQNFAGAVARIAGLEFAGEEELVCRREGPEVFAHAAALDRITTGEILHERFVERLPILDLRARHEAPTVKARELRRVTIAV